MKLKSIIVSAVLLMLFNTVGAQRFVTSLISTANVTTDNVAAMAMDDNYTYVVHNLFTNPSSPPYTSNSFSAFAVSTVTTSEHASVIIERIEKSTGSVTVLGRVDISSFGSSVTATGLKLYNNRLYIVGYFYGTVVPSSLTTKTASGIDMFVFSILNTGGSGIWNQSTGTGEEHATCITEAAGTLYVGGYYTATASIPVSSTWNTGGGAVTAPAIGAVGQRNTFITTFNSSTLTCTAANGWMTLANTSSSAQINGIATVTVGMATSHYVTGSITGSATTPSLTGVASGAVMFTARFTGVWRWAITEGTFYGTFGVGPDPVNAGKAIILGPSSTSELYVVGAAAYVSGTGPTGYHNGQSDAVLIKLSNIATISPTKVFVAPMGVTGANDIANGIVSDGTNVIITGSMQGGNYSYASIGSPTTMVSYTSVAQSHTFAARYTTAGVLDWDKTGYATSSISAGTAIACNGKCHVAIGGSFDRRMTWGNIFEIYGATSPNTNHLYVHHIPVQWMKFSPALPNNMNNPSSVFITASGATTYSWVVIPNSGQSAYPSPPGPGAAKWINLMSGGTAGNTFDVFVLGTYTYGGATCNNGLQHRITQNNKKEDEDVTGVKDAVESMNTLNIFPNPFASEVQLDYSFAEQGEGLLQITDIQGRVVAEHVLNNQSGTASISTTEWSAGTYIAKLSQNGKAIFTKQILKQ